MASHDPVSSPKPALYNLGDAVRSRMNGLFMAIFFTGGAIGSAVGGWGIMSWIGFAAPLLAGILFYR